MNARLKVLTVIRKKNTSVKVKKKKTIKDEGIALYDEKTAY